MAGLRRVGLFSLVRRLRSLSRSQPPHYLINVSVGINASFASGFAEAVALSLVTLTALGTRGALAWLRWCR